MGNEWWGRGWASRDRLQRPLCKRRHKERQWQRLLLSGVATGSMPGQQDTTDKSKRTRQQTTPIKLATPGSKTPDPKQLKKEPTATPKKLFEGA